MPLMNAHCCFPSRSHLQPSSYGPVLSPMNKIHGGVNKLPSVNQLVGQPPSHSSAAGSNLGPMGESLGQRRPHVRYRDPREGLIGFTRIVNRIGRGLLMAAFPAAPVRRRAMATERLPMFIPISGVLCLGVCRSGIVNNTCLPCPSS